MNKKELLSVLSKVKPGIATKGIVEGMKYFFFSGKEIVTYNDQISIQHPLKTDFSLFVKALDIFKIVSRISADEIILKQNKTKLNIKAKGVSVNLNTLKDKEIITRIKNISRSLSKAKWRKLPKNFIECINLCAFAAAKTNSEYTLSCIKIEKDQCIASDNNRIALSTLSKKIHTLFLTASEMPKLLAIEPKFYALTKTWVHFRNSDNCIFSIRRVQGNFPDFTSFIDFEGKEVKLPETLFEGIELASIFTDKDTPLVTITIQENSCVVSVKSSSGNLKFKSKIIYKGNEIKFTINPDFLKEMMKYKTTVLISKEKAKLTTKNFTLVTALYAEE